MLYIFDMGNVVIKGIEVIDKTIKFLGVDAKEFLLDYSHYDFPLMEGSVSVPDYYRHLENVFHVKIKTDPFRDFFEPHFNEPVVEIIKELKKNNKRVICASNTFQPHLDIIQKKHLDQYFDNCYYSHLIGLSKPSIAYFEYIKEKENVEFSDMVFMDDYEENITGANKLGINTFWYKKGYNDSKLFEDYFERFPLN